MRSFWYSRSTRHYILQVSGQETQVPKAAFWCARSCLIAWTLWRTRTSLCRSGPRKQMPSVQLLLLTIQMVEGTLTIASNWCRARLTYSLRTPSSSLPDPSNLIGSHMETAPLPQTSSATASRRTHLDHQWLCAATLKLKRPITKRWKSMSLSRTVCRLRSSRRGPSLPIRTRKPRRIQESTMWMPELKIPRSAIHLSSKCWIVSRCHSDYDTAMSSSPSSG